MSTPTITEEGSGHTRRQYVYLHAPDGRLYKMRADTGADVWAQPAVVDPPVDPTVNDYYAWSSPLPIPARNLIVVGMSSNCDQPFARGGLKAFDMTSGALVWTWWSEPVNPLDAKQWDVGAGVWTGAASDGDNVYVSTGSSTDCGSSASYQALNNPDPVPGKFDGVWHQCDPPGDQYSIVKVDASNGHELGVYHAPDAITGDPDFGSGTTLFPATLNDGRRHQLVGACNKDGYYYAVDTQQDASGRLPLVWRTQIGSPRTDGERACLTGAVYDRKRDHLFIGGNVVSGSTVTGRVRQVDPATGATIWQTALPSNPLGAGTINDNGVLAYAGMEWENQTTNGIFLMDSSTGALLDTNPNVAGYQQLKDPASATPTCAGCTYDQFAQPVWGDGALWMSNRTALTPWRVASN
jgi:hypothetical protein